MLIAHTDVDFENGKKGGKKPICSHVWCCLQSILHFLYFPTCRCLPFISWSQIDFLIASFVSFVASKPSTPPTKYYLEVKDFPSKPFLLIDWLELWIWCWESCHPRTRMGCVGVNTQCVLGYRRAAVIKVKVWEIIHCEIVAVANLHDRGIQNGGHCAAPALHKSLSAIISRYSVSIL